MEGWQGLPHAGDRAQGALNLLHLNRHESSALSWTDHFPIPSNVPYRRAGADGGGGGGGGGKGGEGMPSSYQL